MEGERQCSYKGDPICLDTSFGWPGGVDKLKTLSLISQGWSCSLFPPFSLNPPEGLHPTPALFCQFLLNQRQNFQNIFLRVRKDKKKFLCFQVRDAQGLVEEGKARGAWLRTGLGSLLQTQAFNASALPPSSWPSEPRPIALAVGCRGEGQQSLPPLLTEPSVFTQLHPHFQKC